MSRALRYHMMLSASANGGQEPSAAVAVAARRACTTARTAEVNATRTSRPSSSRLPIVTGPSGMQRRASRSALTRSCRMAHVGSVRLRCSIVAPASCASASRSRSSRGALPRTTTTCSSPPNARRSDRHLSPSSSTNAVCRTRGCESGSRRCRRACLTRTGSSSRFWSAHVGQNLDGRAAITPVGKKRATKLNRQHPCGALPAKAVSSSGVQRDGGTG